MNSSMISPSVVELLTKVDNRYSLVTVAAKRARQIIDGAEPLISISSLKPLTIAINEVYTGAVVYETIKEGIK